MSACAKVWVYPGAAEELRSPVYKVTVKQGRERYESFVYADANKFEKHAKHLTDWNHWTTFSFDAPIQVVVEVLKGDPGNCVIQPLEKKIRHHEQGNRIGFQLDQPAKLFIHFEGMPEDPLFIFADAPEEVPDRNDPNVVWFEPGIHEIGRQYALESGKTYYLEGGSYLKGSMYGRDLSNVTIRGRGILSGEDIPHMGYKEHKFAGVGIRMQDNGRNQLIEGITFINPSMYCIQAYSSPLVTRNIKCFGWWYETDGWVGGDGSLLEDSFFKVNDDVVKLYHSNVVVRDLVIYHQFNGAPFQLGWSSESAEDVKVEHIDIVKSEPFNSRVFNSNRTMINRRRGTPGSVSKNFLFTDIRIDQDISAVIGISTEGRIENFTLRNVTISGKQNFESFLQGGDIKNISFQSLEIGNKRIRKAADIDLQTQGSVSGVTFK